MPRILEFEASHGDLPDGFLQSQAADELPWQGLVYVEGLVEAQVGIGRHILNACLGLRGGLGLSVAAWKMQQAWC